jgi:hypothetical protein
MTTMLSAATTPAAGAPLRTGQNICAHRAMVVRSLSTASVKNVATHYPALRPRGSFAFRIAASPLMLEQMTRSHPQSR